MPIQRLAKRTVGFVAFVLLSVAVLVVAERCWPEFQWRPQQQALQAQYGIAVALQGFSFPPHFRAQRARYRETLRFERKAVLGRLALDLSRYPRDFVREHLTEVVILRSLELNGLDYGGTYEVPSKRIYLDSDWLGDDGTNPEAMGLHHEFSSLLMHRRQDVFRTAEWAALNPEGFRYRFGASSAANLRTGQLDLVGNPELWEQGFLCGYGQLTLEDDINTFAQYLLAGKKRWPELSRRYPRLARKMELLSSWYGAIGFVPPAPKA